MNKNLPQFIQEYHKNNTYNAIISHDLSLLEKSLDVAHQNSVWKNDFYLLRYGPFIALISQQPAEIALSMFSLFIDKYVTDINKFTQFLELITANSINTQWVRLLSQFEEKFKPAWNKSASFRIYYCLALNPHVNTQEFLASHPFIEQAYPVLSSSDYKKLLKIAYSYQSFSFMDFFIQKNPVKTLKHLAQYLNEFSISHIGRSYQAYCENRDFFFTHCFSLTKEEFNKIQKKLDDLIKENDFYMSSRTTALEQQQRLKQLILLLDRIKIHHHLNKHTPSLLYNKPKL